MSSPPQDPQGPESSPGQPSQPSFGAPDQPTGGYHQAPPPSGAYPPPQQGGFTPPTPPGPGPQGQYGQPGPGYGSPAGAYGGPPTEIQATDSLSRGWEAFKANPWPFVIAQVLWGLILTVPMVILMAAFGVFTFSVPTMNPDGTYDAGSTGGVAALFGIGGVVLLLVLIPLTILFYGAFANATLKVMDGARVEIADFFKVRNFAQLALLALILAVASAVLAITFVGPIIVMFFGVWSIFFVIDRNQSAIDAVKSSFTFASRNVGQSIVLILLGYLLNLAGTLACGIGTLVTNPTTLLAYADYYRRVTGPSQPQGFGGPAPQYG